MWTTGFPVVHFFQRLVELGLLLVGQRGAEFGNVRGQRWRRCRRDGRWRWRFRNHGVTLPGQQLRCDDAEVAWAFADVPRSLVHVAQQAIQPVAGALADRVNALKVLRSTQAILLVQAVVLSAPGTWLVVKVPWEIL